VTRNFFVTILAGCAFAGILKADDTRIKIVALGDSITKGVRPGVKVDETFPFYLEQSLRKEKIDAEVVNSGVGSETTSLALARLGKVIALKPRVVAIMYGANDSYVDRGKKESRLTPEAFEANLRKIVAELKAAGIAPILMTSPRQGDKHPLNGAGEHPNVRLEAYMKLTRKVAEDTKTPLVDHYAAWEKINAAGTNISDWTTDHIHLNTRGNREVEEALLPAVLRVVSKAAKDDSR